MRKVALLLAASAALAATPAFAQLGVGIGTGVNAAVGTTVDTGRAVGGTVNTVDRIGTRAVDRTQRLTDRTLDSTRFALATRSQVATGTTVSDSRGQRIGTVSRIDGSTAIVISGNRMYHVPLSALYARTSGAARGLVTTIPRAQLTSHVNAHANAHAAASTGH